MLLTAVNIAGTACEDSVYDPWNCVVPGGHGAVVRNLKKLCDVAVVRSKYARNTSEKEFGVSSVESSVMGESSGHHGVGISNVVEIGDVEFLPESVPALDRPCSSGRVLKRSPGKRKHRKSATKNPAAAPNCLAEFDDESTALSKGRGFILVTRTLTLL